MTGGWERIEPRSAGGVRAWGASPGEAFAHAAEAMFALMLPPEDVVIEETREARAQGPTLEVLVASWLTECLYVHEIEGFAVARVEVDTCRDGLVHGVLHGETLDPTRHRVDTIVKGVSADRVEVRDDGVELRVVFEL